MFFSSTSISFIQIFLSVIKPATITKLADASAPNSGEKSHEEPSKAMNVDENADGEEIADDLSEISDEADDILAQQEVNIVDINARFFLSNSN